MACMQGIMAEIIYRVVMSKLPDFSLWRIVLTNHVPESFAAWGSPALFHSWQAESCEDARAIEAYFVNEKGMIGSSSGKLDSGRATDVCLFPCCDASALQQQWRTLDRSGDLAQLFSVTPSDQP